MKRLLALFLMLISIETFACKCENTTLLEKYQRSEFVATAKISKIVQDIKNDDYHEIDIELISLYKGESRNKLKVISVLNSSCSFLPSENSTWLIFASKDNKGFLSFGSCSGSEQTDLQFDLDEYPDIEVKYKQSLDLKLQILDFIKRKKSMLIISLN